MTYWDAAAIWLGVSAWLALCAWLGWCEWKEDRRQRRAEEICRRLSAETWEREETKP